MQLPLEITYRGLEKTAEIEAMVIERAARLDKFCDHINRCDVVIEQSNHAHKKGNPFRVRIDVTVAGGHELIADESLTEDNSFEPLTKAVHDAFKTMERQLRHLVEKQRGE